MQMLHVVRIARASQSISMSELLKEKYKQKNEASHKCSKKFSSHAKDSRASTQPFGNAPSVEDRIAMKLSSGPKDTFHEDQDEGLSLQELPPNHTPLPEIASSDPPQPCYELPSSESPIREHSHSTALQPCRLDLRPYSASGVYRGPHP